MHLEETAINAKFIKDRVKRGEELGKVYVANMGLIARMAGDYGVQQQYYDDVLQLAYIALHKAVMSYRAEKGFSLSAYFRLSFKHECCTFFRKIKHPIPIDRNLENYNDSIDVVEKAAMDELLFQAISSVLDCKDASIVINRFYYGKKLREIGMSLGMTPEGVRWHIKKAFKILHDDESVQEVAFFYHYI